MWIHSYAILHTEIMRKYPKNETKVYSRKQKYTEEFLLWIQKMERHSKHSAQIKGTHN